MKIPRRIHQLYAFLTRRFWLPCPQCGRMFGGHETGGGHKWTGVGVGFMTCPNCPGNYDTEMNGGFEIIRDDPRVD